VIKHYCLHHGLYHSSFCQSLFYIKFFFVFQVYISMANPLSQAELETGSASRHPKLTSPDDFQNWKTRMKLFFFFTDYTQWNSILISPHKPMITGTDGVSRNTDPISFTHEDKLLIIRDYKAHGALQMALPAEINSQFEKYTKTQELWNALCSFMKEMIS
jgi:hypothetical protein